MTRLRGKLGVSAVGRIKGDANDAGLYVGLTTPGIGTMELTGRTTPQEGNGAVPTVSVNQINAIRDPILLEG
mgnify:CR=1